MNNDHATREAWHPHSTEEHHAILRELQEILASPHFCNSKRYPALLQYIVEHTLDGKAELLKERTLGVDVFGRLPSYDTNTDTVVRYTAGEVRKRLLLYYSEHPTHSGIRIALPPGSYVPEFLPSTEHHQELDHEPIPHAADTPGMEQAPAAPSAQPLPAAHETFRPLRRRLLWISAALVLMLAVSALFVWLHTTATQPQSAVDAFWAPVLHDQRSVVLCTGSVIFNQGSYSGVITAHKDIDYTFVSMQIASAITQVANTVNRTGTSTQLVFSAATPLTELREHSIVLLGGYNNDLTLRLLNPLRFYFAPEPDEGIADRFHPQDALKRNRDLPYSNSDDYAIVARFHDTTTDGWVVALAGLGRNGTEAAAQFATSPHYMQLVRDRVGAGYSSRNIEAVLKINVIEGKTGAPTILDVYVW
jgi:hypothetical protein